MVSIRALEFAVGLQSLLWLSKSVPSYCTRSFNVYLALDNTVKPFVSAICLMHNVRTTIDWDRGRAAAITQKPTIKNALTLEIDTSV